MINAMQFKEMKQERKIIEKGENNWPPEPNDTTYFLCVSYI